MMEYIYKFNIHDDCDFGRNEFCKLASLNTSDFNDINNLNKRLLNEIKSNMIIQINNIDKNRKDKTIINFNVNPK